MKKQLTAIALALLSMAATAQNKEWLDPEVNAVNRAPMHTGYFAYESTAAALAGQKEQSSNFMTLNGPWKFARTSNAFSAGS